MNDPMTSADEQKIREYIKQRSEMKEACDGMWYQRDFSWLNVRSRNYQSMSTDGVRCLFKKLEI